jgi:Xaa-Pro dipeptidase
MTINMLKRLAAVLIPMDGAPIFGVHANEKITARNSTWIKDIRIYEGGEWEPLKPIDFIVDVLKEMGFEKAIIGLESFDIPGLLLDYLRKQMPLATFVDCQHILNRLRATKTSTELKILKDANMATAKAITVAFEMAKQGDSERQIARDMMNLVIKYGADTVAFMTLGAGKNIFETHHIPGDYKIQKGDLIHVDFGGFFEGYFSDISRMAVVGTPNSTQLKAYEIAIEAEYATAEAMNPGVSVWDVHNAVKNFYESKGFEYKRAFIGHGLGIGCHEYPFLGPSHGDWVLEPSMFFQVEPVCIINNARIHTEDSFEITKSGAKNVSLYRDVSELQIIR